MTFSKSPRSVFGLCGSGLRGELQHLATKTVQLPRDIEAFINRG
jgi:hypothetical protein